MIPIYRTPCSDPYLIPLGTVYAYIHKNDLPDGSDEPSERFAAVINRLRRAAVAHTSCICNLILREDDAKWLEATGDCYGPYTPVLPTADMLPVYAGPCHNARLQPLLSVQTFTGPTATRAESLQHALDRLREQSPAGTCAISDLVWSTGYRSSTPTSSSGCCTRASAICYGVFVAPDEGSPPLDTENRLPRRVLIDRNTNPEVDDVDD